MFAVDTERAGSLAETSPAIGVPVDHVLLAVGFWCDFGCAVDTLAVGSKSCSLFRNGLSSGLPNKIWAFYWHIQDAQPFNRQKKGKIKPAIRVKIKSNARQTNLLTKVTPEAAGDLIRRERAAVTRITVRFHQVVSSWPSRFVVEVPGSNQRL